MWNNIRGCLEDSSDMSSADDDDNVSHSVRSSDHSLSMEKFSATNPPSD
jgi:hypothetical protein